MVKRVSLAALTARRWPPFLAVTFLIVLVFAAMAAAHDPGTAVIEVRGTDSGVDTQLQTCPTTSLVPHRAGGGDNGPNAGSAGVSAIEVRSVDTVCVTDIGR
jgi:hypothetical protein